MAPLAFWAKPGNVTSTDSRPRPADATGIRSMRAWLTTARVPAEMVSTSCSPVSGVTVIEVASAARSSRTTSAAGTLVRKSIVRAWTAKPGDETWRS